MLKKLEIMKTLNEMQIIFNIANMRNAITGSMMDLDNLKNYDVYSMDYNELHELQNSLIKYYNESLKK